jgi:hypothetical protein
MLRFVLVYVLGEILESTGEVALLISRDAQCRIRTDDADGGDRHQYEGEHGRVPVQKRQQARPRQ